MYATASIKKMKIGAKLSMVLTVLTGIYARDSYMRMAPPPMSITLVTIFLKTTYQKIYYYEKGYKPRVTSCEERSSQEQVSRWT